MTSEMLRRKEVFTTITPIPTSIPRQLAIDLLHSHSELITVNPLVINLEPIKAPQNAASDEYYSTWYKITERVKFVPGIGKLGTSKISFNACFHDMPWGVQSHVYAPAGVDMRNNWRICGNQPGEPPERKEMGLDAPRDGLYLREDIEIKCNMAMIGFVKAEMKKASKVMVERMVKKAQLLDAGVLQGMFEDGKLKTYNPNDRTDDNRLRPQSVWSDGPASPSVGTLSPQPSFRQSKPQVQSYRPVSMVSSYSIPPAPGAFEVQGNNTHLSPVPAYGQDYKPQQPAIMELPGDYEYYNPPPKTSPRIPHSPSDYNNSTYPSSPTEAGARRWSQASSADSRPESYASNTDSGYGGGGGGGGGAPHRYPSSSGRSYAHDLPTHNETHEEQYNPQTGGTYMTNTNQSAAPPPLPPKGLPIDIPAPLNISQSPRQAAADREQTLRQLDTMNLNDNGIISSTDPNIALHPANSSPPKTPPRSPLRRSISAGQGQDSTLYQQAPPMPPVPYQGGGKPRVVLP